MICKEWGECISAFADDSLEPEKQAALFAHLAGCAGCRSFLASIQRVRTEVKRQETAFPEDLDERILSALAAQRMALRDRSVSRRSFWGRSVAVPVGWMYAGSFALLLLIGLAVGLATRDAGFSQPVVLKPAGVAPCFEMPEIEILSPTLRQRAARGAAEKRPPAEYSVTWLAPGEDDRPPQWNSRAALEYPQTMLRQGLGGRVAFLLRIDETGRIVQIQSAYPADEKSTFAQAALPVVKQLQYQPALHQGRPVAAWVRITLFFKSEETEFYRTMEQIFA